ncbi:MAG: hypothetical protein AB9869_22450 [Verrucomicrobiia bacterium]
MRPDSPQSNGSKKPLPKPNATMKLGGSSVQNFTEEEVRGMIANPIYAGIGPYPQLIPDEQWVRCAAKAIAQDGAEQFLVNMLHVLRQAMVGRC